MSLAGFFSEDFRKNFAEREIELRKTILVEIPDFNINHKKFIIVVGIDDPSDEIAFVVINSEINPQVFSNDYLKAQHVSIDCKEHNDFLHYDSYVDCSTLRYESKSAIIRYIFDNPSMVKSNVSEIVFKQIVETITYSRLISKAEKRKYGFA